jgi:hypothetical protein
MPYGDGSGPPGGAGKRRGQGQGGRQGQGRRGGFTAGPGGHCVCPRCGKSLPHERGRPCYQAVCPDCGIPMARER